MFENDFSDGKLFLITDGILGNANIPELVILLEVIKFIKKSFLKYLDGFFLDNSRIVSFGVWPFCRLS